MGPVLGHQHGDQGNVTDLTALETDAVALVQRAPAAGAGRRDVVLDGIGHGGHRQPRPARTRLTAPLTAGLRRRPLLRPTADATGPTPRGTSRAPPQPPAP